MAAWCALVALQRGISARLYFSAGFVTLIENEQNRKWPLPTYYTTLTSRLTHALCKMSLIFLCWFCKFQFNSCLTHTQRYTTGVRIETHFMHCAFQQQPLQWFRYFSLEFSWMLRQSWKESFCVALLKLSNAWAYVCLVLQKRAIPPLSCRILIHSSKDPPHLRKNPCTRVHSSGPGLCDIF